MACAVRSQRRRLRYVIRSFSREAWSEKKKRGLDHIRRMTGSSCYCIGESTNANDHQLLSHVADCETNPPVPPRKSNPCPKSPKSILTAVSVNNGDHETSHESMPGRRSRQCARAHTPLHVETRRYITRRDSPSNETSSELWSSDFLNIDFFLHSSPTLSSLLLLIAPRTETKTESPGHNDRAGGVPHAHPLDSIG